MARVVRGVCAGASGGRGCGRTDLQTQGQVQSDGLQERGEEEGGDRGDVLRAQPAHLHRHQHLVQPGVLGLRRVMLHRLSLHRQSFY